MWITASLLLAPLLSTSPQSPPPGLGPTEGDAAREATTHQAGSASSKEADESREVYLDLLKRYNNEVGAHRFDCLKLNEAGVPRDQWPPSPLFSYHAKFVELADEGNGHAQYWVVVNCKEVVTDPLERRELLERMFTSLARDHATGGHVVEVIDQLFRHRRLLGLDFVRQQLQTLSTNSHSAEIEAKALLVEASILWKNGNPESKQDTASAVELWQILVDGYAGTDSAKDAAQYLFHRTNRAMRKAQNQWMETVRALCDDGVGPEGWPVYPVGAFRGQFEAMAATKHGLSSYQVDVYFPAYEQASREGIISLLRFIVDDTAMRFQPFEWPWQDIRFNILQLFFDLYPDEPWIYEEVLRLEESAKRHDPERYEPLLGSLIEKTSDERTKYQAMLILAKSLEQSKTLDKLERALELYAEIVSSSPIERQRKEAEIARREFSWTMPGAEMPDFEAKDGEGLPLNTTDYRGRVLVLYFWGFWSPDSMEDLPWINGIHAKYAGQPLAVLGVNSDRISYAAYANKSRKAGVTWRSAFDGKVHGPQATRYKVRNYPETIVIDAQGVIRGRALDHEQAEALIDKLLAEVAGEVVEPAVTEERGVPADRGLQGRVIFDGPREVLPPLVFTEKQAAGCCAAGHEVDATNRKRLVDPEGGLANVVVYVEVEGATLNGTGTEVILDQKSCRFEPHVSVVPVGGSLLIKNSDGVSHNINMRSRYNGSINEMMPAGTSKQLMLERGDKLTLGCDVHPWMSSHVFVVETPYWALTGPDGSFTIPDLPPGEHIVRYWHEELGSRKSERVTVVAGQPTQLELKMAPKAKGGGRRGKR